MKDTERVAKRIAYVQLWADEKIRRLKEIKDGGSTIRGEQAELRRRLKAYRDEIKFLKAY